MKMKLRIAVGVMLAALALGLTGCSEYTDASNAVSVIGNIVQIAQADLPALATSGVFSPTEAANVTNYLAAASVLNTQAGTCVATAHAAGNSKSAFLACFNAFSAGLLNPAELVLLHVSSTKGQSTVQLWVTATVLAVNGILGLVGGTSVTVPTLATDMPSHQDLVAFARHAHVGASYGF